MTKKSYKETLGSHFAVIALVLGAMAALGKAWHDAPPWAYLLLLALAPLTAFLFTGIGAARTTFIRRRRDNLQFPTGTVAHLGRAVRDLLSAVRSGSAGIAICVCDKPRASEWIDRVLKALHDTLKRTDSLPEDVYVIWLKATSDGQRISAEKACNAPQGYLDGHVKFEKGDGLAGRVWESGEAAVHSTRRPNAHWQSRPGCDNASYVCVPIGQKGGLGGVLALGSDIGFEVTNAQIEILKVFASLLALADEADSQGSNN